MRAVLRWAVGLVIVAHGLVHLLGVVEGFGWADVDQLTEPIGSAMGAAWLVACVLVVASGALLLARVPWWWAVAAVAAGVSQVVIVTSWSDAKAGTLGNVLLALAALYGYRSQGPASYRARFRQLSRETTAATSSGGAAGAVAESDLDHLPPAVAAYVRSVGAVGRPHVRGFRAVISGRIRAGADDAWMPWTGEQVNTFGAAPSRVLFMDATMHGIPADVLHAYVGATATMQVRVASLVKLVDAHGDDMDQAETVTLLNDLCVLAPAALVDASIDWAIVDECHVRATFANAGHTVSAVLAFDEAHRLVDFVSDDRLRASSDGTTFTPMRWSTPIGGYRAFGGRLVGAVGRGRWHPAEMPAFDYLEFNVDDITYLEVRDSRDLDTEGAPDTGGSPRSLAG
jgi:Family of unknown function (DUF6544)